MKGNMKNILGYKDDAIYIYKYIKPCLRLIKMLFFRKKKRKKKGLKERKNPLLYCKRWQKNYKNWKYCIRITNRITTEFLKG